MEYSVRIKSSVISLFAIILLAAAAVTGADDITQLNGRWKFNPGRSDDAARKVKEAKEVVERASANALRPIAGTSAGTNLDRAGNVSGVAALDVPNFSDQEWSGFAQNPKSLQIDQHPDQVVVTPDPGQPQAIYPDGKKREATDASGKKMTVKAEWRDGLLVAETKLGHSKKVTRKFQLLGDGKQLCITTLIDLRSFENPVVIRRVYDLEKTATK